RSRDAERRGHRCDGHAQHAPNVFQHGFTAFVFRSCNRRERNARREQCRCGLCGLCDLRDLRGSTSLSGVCVSCYHEICLVTPTWPAPTVTDGAPPAVFLPLRVPKNIIVPPANAMASPAAPSGLFTALASPNSANSPFLLLMK